MIQNNLYTALNKLNDETLLEYLEFHLPETFSATVIIRVLKDRLEGLDNVVRVEALNDKVVGA